MRKDSQQTLRTDDCEFQHFLRNQFVIVNFSWFCFTLIIYTLIAPVHNIICVVAKEMSFGSFKVNDVSIRTRNNYKVWNVRCNFFVLKNKKKGMIQMGKLRIILNNLKFTW